MPLVFRAMRRDEDGLPTVGPAANALGVRPGADIDIDRLDNAVVNHKGMSVSRAWREMHLFRIPKRLGHGGQGSNHTYCFRTGDGVFRQAAFVPGLELLPDSQTHGVVRPTQLAPLAQYEGDLAATRAEWQIDET
jgi:hypothetical protein